MSKRVGGFINQDGLNAPDPATGVTASAGDTAATVSFTAPSDVGGSAITGFVATSNDGIGATGSSSPITVTGLTNDTAYTFRVWALNAFGYSAPSDASGSVTPAAPRGVFAGGAGGATTMDFVTISTTGNAASFGTTASSSYNAGCASSTRGLFAIGASSNVIHYITIASAGNSADFGDLTVSRERAAACSSSTRGVFAGGYTGSTDVNVIDYVTIASLGNASDFGDLTRSRREFGGASSPTRALFIAGVTISSGGVNVIDYVTIASTGNATDFGDITGRGGEAATFSSSIYAINAGGFDSDLGAVSRIQRITIATTGNASSFGNLSAATYGPPAGCSSSTRGLVGGGRQTAFGTTVNTIEFITIAGGGGSSDFGDLTSARYALAACSNAHGGLS